MEVGAYIDRYAYQMSNQVWRTALPKAGQFLAQIRAITSDFQLPEDACETSRALYDGLRDLEADLHEHIHLENNILFPEAVDVEARTQQ